MALTGYAGYRTYLIAIKYYKQAKANEYMIILRNGQNHKAGVGLCAWTMPGDQVVTFPSSINQVTFKAQQVTHEMQGIEVSGLMIWSIYRDKDGPFKAFRSFGEELQRKNSTIINDKL